MASFRKHGNVWYYASPMPTASSGKSRVVLTGARPRSLPATRKPRPPKSRPEKTRRLSLIGSMPPSRWRTI
jgi:hypothetical protein